MMRFITARAISATAILTLTWAVVPRTDANPTDFARNEAGGNKTFALSKAKGRYAALHFLLKTECPICLKHTQTCHARNASAPGVQHLFITPAEKSDALKWAAGLSPEDRADAPVIYQDPGASPDFSHPQAMKDSTSCGKIPLCSDRENGVLV